MQKILLCGCILAISTANVSAGAETGGAKHPNILWIIAEDIGPELACYGHPEVRTPVLDGLAASGVRYTRAFTVTPVCSTSRSSFMTGMYAHSIGAHNHRSHRTDEFRLEEGVRVLTDWFRPAGYFTANITNFPTDNPDKSFFKGTGKTKRGNNRGGTRDPVIDLNNKGIAFLLNRSGVNLTLVRSDLRQRACRHNRNNGHQRGGRNPP